MTRGRTKDMTDIKEVIHRLRVGHSIRRITKELRTRRTIIRALHALAVRKGWLNATVPFPSDEEITNEFPKVKTAPQPLDVYREDIERWYQEGLSAVIMQRLLKDKYSCDIQVIRRYLKKNFTKPPKPVMVRETVPGQHLDTDFGYLGKFRNDDGIEVKAWLFSFRLRHSRKAYREIVLNQKTSTFLMGHVYAFESFNGVPANVILDNTKAGIIQSTIDNDMVRHSYQELALHYGFIIAPCAPRTPEHKGGVENDVKYVKKNFLPFFLEKQKELNIKVPKLRDLVDALKRWESEVDDLHIVHGVGSSPLALFKNEEEKALQPLPSTRWELTSWCRCTARRDWRIMVDNAYYSVPYTFIGQTLEVCLTHNCVRIFHEHKEIALHERAKKKWEYKRKADHAPPFQEAVLQCTREGLLTLAESIGPFTRELAQAILLHPSVNKLKPVRCLVRLAEKYSKQRLKQACQRAFDCRLHSYKSVKSILEKGLDLQPLDTAPKNKIVPLPIYRFARDPADYSSMKTQFTEILEERCPASTEGNGMLGGWYGHIADQIIREGDS